MNMKNYSRIALTIVFLFYVTIIVGQKAEYKFKEDSSAVKVDVIINRTKLQVEDNDSKRRGLPLRISVNFPFRYKLSDIGSWKTSPDNGNNVWLFEMSVPGANGLIVSFDDFYIPLGGKLYVYNVTKKDYDSWTYSHEDNPNGGPYSLEVFSQDNIVFEYTAPDSLKEKPRFETTDFGYKYSEGLQGFNDNMNICMPNINCNGAVGWQKQKMGVVRMKINTSKGSSLCTGTLINNTRDDKTPYILTAQHCFPNNSPADVKDTEFFFDYEFPNCNNSTQRPQYKYKKGAQSLILNPMNGGSDGALILMNEPIPDNWTVYFNGWNLVDAEKTYKEGAVIHHPRGDVKKISFYNGYLATTRWTYDGKTGTPNAHWITSYSQGSTQGGSSGAPLFDRDGLIIGTLSGGSSQCDGKKANKGTDLYGKMAYHWDKSEDPALRMKQYLDPDNTGVTKYGGRFNVEEKELILSKTDVFVRETATVNVYILGGNGEYVATSDNPAVATAYIADNTVIIEGHTVGTAKITLRDKLSKEKSIEVEVTEMIYKDLTLSTGSIIIPRNNIYDIYIMSGNGNYSLTLSDPSVAEVALKDDLIEVKGLRVGKTELKVKDRSKKEIKVSISVRQVVDMSAASGVLLIRINNDDELIDWVTISDLSGREIGRFDNISRKEYLADISNIPGGTYIVMMKTKSNKRITRKVAW